jgi:hypothetical protein
MSVAKIKTARPTLDAIVTVASRRSRDDLAGRFTGGGAAVD